MIVDWSREGGYVFPGTYARSYGGGRVLEFVFYSTRILTLWPRGFTLTLRVRDATTLTLEDRTFALTKDD